MNTTLRVAVLAGILTLTALSAFAASLDVVFYDDQFGTINDATGAYSGVGTLPVKESAGIASMNGLLYLEDMGTYLYTVDPLTGVSNLVGGTGLNTVAGAFAGDLDGLFEVDYSSNLYAVNPITGKATLVGATGIAANNGAYDTSLSADGAALYYTAGSPGKDDELYEINTVTGVATDLGSTGVTGIAGSALVGSELELFQYGQSTNYIYAAPVGLTDFSKQTPLSAQIVDGGAVFIPANSSGAQMETAPEPGPGLLVAAGFLFRAIMPRSWRRVISPERC